MDQIESSFWNLTLKLRFSFRPKAERMSNRYFPRLSSRYLGRPDVRRIHCAFLLVDSWYDTNTGASIFSSASFEGQVKAGDQLISFATGLKYTVGEVGISRYPDQTPQTVLRAGYARSGTSTSTRG